MNKNYLVYPCKVMKVTQNYLGRTSHYTHTSGTPKDYPIDEGGKDSGRDGFYCPCDELKIVKTYGAGNRGTNTIWVESTSKVYFADGTSDYVSGMIIHPNDSDLKKLYAGKKFKRNELICYEGTDGATANHLHMSFGKGKIKGSGWTQNTKGKWVLTTTNGTYKPEALFYIDPNFTKVMSKGGIAFKNLPKEKTYTTGKYKVTKTDLLRIRPTAGTDQPYKKFAELSESAQNKIKALSGNKAADGYVRNMEFTVTKVKDNWGYNNSGWMCLDYCTKIT